MNGNQQKQEHIDTIKIQRVDNGFIVRVPNEGVKVFLLFDDVIKYIKSFYFGDL